MVLSIILKPGFDVFQPAKPRTDQHHLLSDPHPLPPQGNSV